MSCEHRQLLDDIVAAILLEDVEAESADFIKKVKLCAFSHFLNYFCRTNPHATVKVYNEALCYDLRHMKYVQGKLRRENYDDVIAELKDSLGVPVAVLYHWLGPRWNTQVVCAAYCASAVTLRHVSPLIATVLAKGRHFLEFMCLYNRAWVLGKLIPEHELCCRESRTIYAARIFACSAEEEAAEPFELALKLRTLLGIPPREKLREETPEVNYPVLFGDMTIKM